jgi:hypothetical protein
MNGFGETTVEYIEQNLPEFEAPEVTATNGRVYIVYNTHLKKSRIYWTAGATKDQNAILCWVETQGYDVI